MVVSSWAVSARTLLLVRSAILVFCTISLLVMIDPVHNGVGAIGGAFFWFTNWGFILLTLYFGQAVAYTLRGPPPESSAAQPQTAWQTAIWLNFEIAGMSAICCAVRYAHTLPRSCVSDGVCSLTWAWMARKSGVEA